MQNLVSVETLEKQSIAELFELADEMREMTNDTEGRRELAARYFGQQMCSLFYEPSTRTRISFEQAATKLGLGVVTTENAREFSSAAKGETIEDTIRVLDEYDFSAIVIRHDETGSVARAAAVARTPVVNAGDGKGEHPTQALLDLYTIDRYIGKLDGLNVVVGGDLARGRTARSLVKLLAKYENNAFSFVSTDALAMGDDIKAQLAAANVGYTETRSVEGALSGADVVYWTRSQKERAPDLGPESGIADQDPELILDNQAIRSLPEHAIIMHPLPRVGEIAPEVDDDPRAQYFKQAGNGLYVRMALIDTILR